MEVNAALLTGEPSPGARSTLSGSLQRDVARFLATPSSGELLPVLAASVRHLRPITTILARNDLEIHLMLDPREQMFECNLDLLALDDAQFSELRLQRVDDATPTGTPHHAPLVGRLDRLLWRAAMVGNRGEILPEIDGPATYRVSGGFRHGRLPMAAALEPAMSRLCGPPATLTELQRIVGDRLLPQRLLNALYLASALIVTRAGPTRPRNLGPLRKQST